MEQKESKTSDKEETVKNNHDDIKKTKEAKR